MAAWAVTAEWTAVELPTMATVVLKLAYDGATYAGLAIQSNANSVGNELMAAARKLDPSADALRVASRTDAGVHARDNRVAFDVQHDIPPRGWVLGLNRHLPSSVAVLGAAIAPDGYNPRFAARHKRYRYLLRAARLDDPFWVKRAWRVVELESPGAVERLAAELQPAIGKHDFKAFSSSRDRREHTVRSLTAVEAKRVPDHDGACRLVAVDVSGDGFLHNMVRILVGNAVDVARGRLEPGSTARALVSRDRRDLGVTAPPDGLYLEELRLEDDPGLDWP